MEIKCTKSNLIMFGYFIAATILLLDCTDNFPGTSLLRKFKYIFIVILLLDFITSNLKRISKPCAVVVGCLMLHTVLFGVVIVNPAVAELTKTHFSEMMIYLLFLGFLTNAVERYRCELKFIEATSAACAIFMLWTGVTHISNFVNPLYYIYVFSRNARIRSHFGVGDPNYMGYYCLIALVFFFVLWYKYLENNTLTKKRKYFLLGISGWTVLILFSTGSRSSVLSFLIFIAIWCYKKYLKPKWGKNAFLYIALLFIICVAFVGLNWTDIWGNANREANISVNIPVFNHLNAFWKGMGYIESAGFYNDAYGYDTWPVDIYYLYIFLSTGVIGTVIISIPLVYILVKLLKKSDDFVDKLILPAYLAILFDGMWQVNIFTYRYIATLFIGALLLISISLHKNRVLTRMQQK